MGITSLRAAGAFALLGLASAWVSAQQPTDAAAKELGEAFEAAKAVQQVGPTDIKLGNQATLHLPKGHLFVPTTEANRILKAMGNRPSPDTLGMIFPTAADANWIAIARYVASGYIKDDDAKEWKSDEMLEQIKEGTEAGNDERRKRGIAEMQVVGWVERPTYEAATHRLVWSIESKDKSPRADSDHGINYNTFLLGREGYVSINFVTDLSAIEAQKPLAKELLAAVEFEKGKTYGEFNSSTDHLAEFGLAALVGGVAAKKLGLFALIAAFAVKFAKVIALGAIAIGAGAFKFLKRDKGDTPKT
jgi:uncharacterized membrane-anchored protein